MEQRLIDANELYGIESLLNTDIVQNSPEASWLMSQVLHDIQASPTIDPEALPIVRQLRAELARVTAERNAAVNDLRGCSIESYAECMYCIYRTAKSFCQNCQEGSEWKYRGPKKDRQKPKPLTPAQVKAMDYEKVWIGYGEDGEWGIVVDGLLYSISTLEGAGFEDMLQDAVRGEDVERPSGSYRLYRTQRIYEEENHAEAD